MEAQNCITTRELLNHPLFAPLLNLPFITVEGAKEDRKKDG
jgi:hypothetical protein